MKAAVKIEIRICIMCACIIAGLSAIIFPSIFCLDYKDGYIEGINDEIFEFDYGDDEQLSALSLSIPRIGCHKNAKLNKNISIQIPMVEYDSENFRTAQDAKIKYKGHEYLFKLKINKKTLGKLNPVIQGEQLIWNDNDEVESYNIYMIVNDKKDLLIEDVEDNFINLGQIEYDGEIELMIEPNVKHDQFFQESETIKFNKIKKIPDVKLDCNTLTWGEVPNVKSFDVYLNGKLYLKDLLTNKVEIPFVEGDNEIEIKSNAMEGYVSNRYTAKYHKLLTPKVDVKNNELSWDAVDFAESYKITYGTDVNNLNKEISFVDKYVMNLEHLSHDTIYYFNISAISPKIDVINSDVNAFEVLLFNEISNIRYSDGKLQWDPNSYADGYRVYINGKETKEVLDNFLEITLADTTTFNIYPFSSNSGYVNPTIASKTIEKLKSVEQFVFDDKKISWNAVPHASNYLIYCNGILIDSIEDEQYTISKNLKDDINDLEIISTNNDGNYIQSNVFSCKFINNYMIEQKNGNLTYKKFDNVTYTIYDGDVPLICFENESPNLYDLLVDSKIYNLKLSISDCYGFSNVYTVEKLKEPVARIENKVLIYSPASNLVIEDNGALFDGDLQNIIKEGEHLLTLYYTATSNHELNSDTIEIPLFKLHKPSIEFSGLNMVISNDKASKYNRILYGESENSLCNSVKTSDNNVYLGNLDDNKLYHYDIIASSDVENCLDSESVKGTVLIFSNITNIVYKEGKILWDANINAETYHLNINGTDMPAVVTNELEYNLLDASKVVIYPYSTKKGHIYREKTEKTFYQLEDIQGFDFKNGIISWNLVNNATDYIVYVNDKKIDTIKSTKYELKCDLIDGINSIKICAINSTGTYINSNIVENKILNNLIISVKNGVLSHMKLDNVEFGLYDGNNIISKYVGESINLFDILKEEKSYSLIVRLQGIHGESNKLDIKKLEKPKFYILDNIIISDNENVEIKHSGNYFDGNLSKLKNVGINDVTLQNMATNDNELDSEIVLLRFNKLEVPNLATINGRFNIESDIEIKIDNVVFDGKYENILPGNHTVVAKNLAKDVYDLDSECTNNIIINKLNAPVISYNKKVNVINGNRVWVDGKLVPDLNSITNGVHLIEAQNVTNINGQLNSNVVHMEVFVNDISISASLAYQNKSQLNVFVKNANKYPDVGYDISFDFYAKSGEKVETINFIQNDENFYRVGLDRVVPGANEKYVVNKIIIIVKFKFNKPNNIFNNGLAYECYLEEEL